MDPTQPPSGKRQRLGSDSTNGITPTHELGRSTPFPGMLVREHVFTVPLDYSGTTSFQGQTITLFARELLSPARNESLPFLVYLQGN